VLENTIPSFLTSRAIVPSGWVHSYDQKNSLDAYTLSITCLENFVRVSLCDFVYDYFFHLQELLYHCPFLLWS
jgi:hypothetical protein